MRVTARGRALALFFCVAWVVFLAAGAALAGPLPKCEGFSPQSPTWGLLSGSGAAPRIDPKPTRALDASTAEPGRFTVVLDSTEALKFVVHAASGDCEVAPRAAWVTNGKPAPHLIAGAAIDTATLEDVFQGSKIGLKGTTLSALVATGDPPRDGACPAQPRPVTWTFGSALGILGEQHAQHLAMYLPLDPKTTRACAKVLDLDRDESDLVVEVGGVKRRIKVADAVNQGPISRLAFFTESRDVTCSFHVEPGGAPHPCGKPVQLPDGFSIGVTARPVRVAFVGDVSSSTCPAEPPEAGEASYTQKLAVCAYQKIDSHWVLASGGNAVPGLRIVVRLGDIKSEPLVLDPSSPVTVEPKGRRSLSWALRLTGTEGFPTAQDEEAPAVSLRAIQLRELPERAVYRVASDDVRPFDGLDWLCVDAALVRDAGGDPTDRALVSNLTAKFLGVDVERGSFASDGSRICPKLSPQENEAINKVREILEAHRFEVVYSIAEQPFLRRTLFSSVRLAGAIVLENSKARSPRRVTSWDMGGDNLGLDGELCVRANEPAAELPPSISVERSRFRLTVAENGKPVVFQIDVHTDAKHLSEPKPRQWIDMKRAGDDLYCASIGPDSNMLRIATFTSQDGPRVTPLVHAGSRLELEVVKDTGENRSEKASPSKDAGPEPPTVFAPKAWTASWLSREQRIGLDITFALRPGSAPATLGVGLRLPMFTGDLRLLPWLRVGFEEGASAFAGVPLVQTQEQVDGRQNHAPGCSGADCYRRAVTTSILAEHYLALCARVEVATGRGPLPTLRPELCAGVQNGLAIDFVQLTRTDGSAVVDGRNVGLEPFGGFARLGGSL